MTTLTHSESSNSAVTAETSLRIVQAGEPDRLFPLPVGKCTIGSSERCQVHLKSQSVRPLHCLIVVEGSAVSVTRWAPGALLNGQDFSTTEFQADDCLTIGDVQLTLVADTSNSSAAPDVSQPEVTTTSNRTIETPTPSETSLAFAKPIEKADQSAVTGEPQNTHSTTLPAERSLKQEAQDDQILRLRAASTDARRRCRKLVGELRATRTEASTFAQQIEDLQQQLRIALEEREQIFTELSSLQSEASQRESQSAEEIDRLIAELTAAYEKAGSNESLVADFQGRIEQLEPELAQLQSERDQWEQTRSAGELQRNKLSQALADRERSIETLQAELENLRESEACTNAERKNQETALEELQTNLDQLITEREQYTVAQEQTLQQLRSNEQALANSEQNLSVLQLEVEKLRMTSGQVEQELIERNAGYENLEAEYGKLCEERDNLVAKRTEYQLREQGWEHELSSRDKQIENLTEEIESLRTKMAESGVAAAEQESQVESIHQQMDNLANERDQLLASQADQLEKIREWEETVAARDRRIHELEEEHDGICQVLQSVEQGSFEQVDYCNKLEKQLASLREERDQLANALPEQQDYIKQLEQTLAEREGQITLLSEELTSLGEQHGDIQRELSEGTSAFQELNAEMRELETRCQQMVETQEVSDQNRTAAEQTIAEYQKQNTELQEQIEQANQHRQELEMVVKDGSQSSDQFQAQLQELQSRYQQLTTEHQEETDRRNELEKQLGERQQDIELFQVDLKSVKAELERSVDQVSALQTERETLNQQLLGLREELASQEKVSDLSNDDLQKERDSLVDELAALRQELEQAQSSSEPLADQSDSAQEWAAQFGNDDLQNLQREPSENIFEQEQQLQYEEQIEETSYDLKEIDSSSIEQEQAADESFQLPDPIVDQPQDELQDNFEKASDSISEEGLGKTSEQEQENSIFESDDDSTSESKLESTSSELLENSGEFGVIKQEIQDQLPDATDSQTEGIKQVEESSELPLIAESEQVALPADDESLAESEPQKEEFQPTSFIDQYQHLLEDDNQADFQPTHPDPPAQTNKLGAELDALDSNCDEESDDAALEAYMSNMLQRMRGESNDESSQPPQSSNENELNQHPDPVKAVDEVLDRVTQESEAEQEPEDVEPIDLEKLKQSSRKPELPTDMAAMRELANSSARRAIAKHYKRRHLEKALGQFFVCLICMCVGGYMLMTAMTTQEYLGLSFLGGTVATLVGAIGGFKLLRLLLLAIREGSWEKRSPEGKAGNATDKVPTESAPNPQS